MIKIHKTKKKKKKEKEKRKRLKEEKYARRYKTGQVKVQEGK